MNYALIRFHSRRCQVYNITMKLSSPNRLPHFLAMLLLLRSHVGGL